MFLTRVGVSIILDYSQIIPNYSGQNSICYQSSQNYSSIIPTSLVPGELNIGCPHDPLAVIVINRTVVGHVNVYMQGIMLFLLYMQYVATFYGSYHSYLAR